MEFSSQSPALDFVKCRKIRIRVVDVSVLKILIQKRMRINFQAFSPTVL